MRRPPSLLLAVAAVALVAVGVAFGWQTLLQPAAPSTPGVPTTGGIARPGAPAPQIALPVVGGGTSDLGGERGKVLLVNFWATWCEPCRTEMPGLQRLADELQNKPFRLYSVDLQETSEQVLAFQQQYGLNLHVVLDEDGDVTRAYGVRGLPATFVIDPQGVLRLQRLGPLASGGTETTWSEPWLADQVRGLLATS